MATKSANSTHNTHKNTFSNAQKLVDAWLQRKPSFSGQTEAATLSFRNQPEAMTLAEIMSHSQTVAALLQEWGASPALQAAGLLHSFLWNCVIEDAEVTNSCGEHVLFLCRQYQHILQRMPETRWRGKRVVLERIKYFVAAYCHFDLAFLAAADLWDRFRLALQSEPSQQHQYIQEGSQVLSPYLDFLGMRELKEELDEQLESQFRQATPELLRAQQADAQMVAEIAQQLQPHLPNATLHYRKYASSSPLLRADIAFSEPNRPSQTLNIDILVDNIQACYAALHQLHIHYTPIEAGFADHIRAGRLNGFRGLQTAVVVTQGDDASQRAKRRVNFCICTRDMDEVNCWGLAAWHLRKKIELETPGAWWHDAASAYVDIESAPLGALRDTNYVFSPQGQLFHFHRGCTVVDYAYYVHSDLAAQVRRFYLNGVPVEPATVLHHLDLVELEYDTHAPGPTRVWLNAARTSRARSKIDRHLKRLGQGIYHGQRTIDTRLTKLENHYGFNIPEHRITQAISNEMRRRNLASMEELLSEVAAGRLDADRILHPLFADEIIRQVQIPSAMRLRPDQLQLAQCCRPRLGDDIVGRPYARDGVVTRLKVHQASCTRLHHLHGNTPLKWRLQPELKTVAQLEIQALDEDGLLGDALGQIYTMLPRVTLHKAEAVARHGAARVRFILEAESQDVLDEIVDAMRRLPSRHVTEVRTTSLPFSEREELVKPVNNAEVNPYSRLPVNEDGMFFGRSQELNDLRNWLATRVGVIWLLGQKRVGKTSLLLHLKNRFLERAEFVPVFIDFQLLGKLTTASVFFEIATAIYNELQSEGRIGELGAPLREMFDHDPPGHLVRYLQGVQSHPGIGQIVLLLDEFSRTTDAYHHGRLDESFFQMWRGLLQDTRLHVKFIVVVQQQAYDGMAVRVQGGQDDPAWPLLELGEKLPLSPLSDMDALHLIEWPMRNYLEFPPEISAQLYLLTGGSPFMIQAFCFKLVHHMVQLNKRRVDASDLERISMEFLSPTESLFAHLLDVIRGVANSICAHLARMADEEHAAQPHVAPTVTQEQLNAALPTIPADRLRRTLQELCDHHVLVRVGTSEWRFASLLFQRWLALNSVAEG